MPREAPGTWPEDAKVAQQMFWETKRKRQQEIDESIQRNAEQEMLYDKPEIDRSRVRVSGPFTVESIPTPAIIDPNESPIPQWESLEPDARDDGIARRGHAVAGDAANFILNLIQAMRKDGITSMRGGTLRFARLNPIPPAASSTPGVSYSYRTVRPLRQAQGTP